MVAWTTTSQPLIGSNSQEYVPKKSPTQEPPPSPFRQLTRTMVWVSPGRKLGPWSEFPFLYRFTVLLNSGGSNSPWSEFWSEFPRFMGMGVVPAPSKKGFHKWTPKLNVSGAFLNAGLTKDKLGVSRLRGPGTPSEGLMEQADHGASKTFVDRF